MPKLLHQSIECHDDDDDDGDDDDDDDDDDDAAYDILLLLTCRPYIEWTDKWSILE